MIINEYVHIQAKQLNNSGGPQSRVRSEKIDKNYLKEGNVAIVSEIIALQLPTDSVDPETFLLKMAAKLGWKNWDEVIRNTPLPNKKMTIIDASAHTEETGKEPHTILRNALILAKSNPLYYLPGGEMIFSRKRLNRKIKLYNIQIKNFYELD